MGRLFGTDGARGVANTELTCETAMAIGRAAAMVLAEAEHHQAENRDRQRHPHLLRYAGGGAGGGALLGGGGRHAARRAAHPGRWPIW